MIRKADRHTGRPLRRIAVYSALLVLLSAGVWYYRHLLARSLCRYDARVCSVDTGALSEQPLYNILRDNGITEPQLSAISAKLATVIDPQDLRRGDAYFVSVSTTGVFLRLVVTHGLTRYYVAGIKNGRLKAGTINIPVLERRVEIAGKIKSSLWESMAQQVEEKKYPQVDFVIRREGASPDSLIQILHGVQEALGYLPEDVQKYIAKKLKIPMSAISTWLRSSWTEPMTR